MSVRDVIQAAAGVGGAGAETDPYFANTTLLLQGDVSNPDLTYNAFSDASGNDVNITPNGDARGSSFSPYNTSWGVEFPSGAYLNTPAINFGTNAFTIEGWFNYSQISSGFVPIFGASNGGGANPKTAVYFNSNSLVLDIDGSGNTISIGSASSFCQPGKWFHLALVRNSSGATAFFVDGVRRNTPVTVGNRSSVTADFAIARTESGLIPSGTTGYFSNFHVVNGATLYDPNQSSISVPTSQITNTANTVRRMCMSNRFIDISPSPVSVTPVSTPKITGASPFLDTDTTTGSGYFDGTTDDLTVSSNAALQLASESNWTVEFWGYFVSSPSDFDVILGKGTGSGSYEYFFEAFADRTIDILYSGNGTTTWTGQHQLTPVLNLNEWFHFAAVRNGATFKSYVNGVEYFSGSSFNIYAGSGVLNIGGYSGAAGQDPNMYLSNVRIVKGTAVYTSNFTPSTSPLTAIANTSLLTCQTRGAVRNIGFRDESEFNHVITKVGNCAQGTFSPFSQEEGKWSIFKDGDSRITSPNTSGYQFGTGDFTVEAFIYVPSGPANDYVTSSWGIIAQCAASGSWNDGWTLATNLNSGILRVVWYENGAAPLAGTAIPRDRWVHVAVARSGTSIRLFYDGVVVDTATSSANYVPTRELSIGGQNTGTDYQFKNGYISNVRVVKGTALYTSAFTVPTEPLSSVANTSLLTLGFNRIFDLSSPSKSFNATGNLSVQPFSPFAPSAAYDPDVNGGSVYLDGSGDWVIVNTPGDIIYPGAFTVEGWFYRRNASKVHQVFAASGFATGANYLRLEIDGGSGYFYNTSDALRSSAGSVKLNEWTHFVFTRDSSNNIAFFLNGVRRDSASNISGNIYLVPNGQTFVLGQWLYDPTRDFDGYISSVRAIGSSIYDPTLSTLTVPTAPPTPTSNTSLLLNFTNAGVIDATGRNVIETVGTARVETSVKKYGTGSIHISTPIGQKLRATPTPNLIFGVSDFTIEFWYYAISKPDLAPCIITNDDSGAFPTNYWAIHDRHYQATAGKFSFWMGNATSGGPLLTGTTTVSNGTWYYISVTRSGNTFRLFVDGSLEDSDTSSASMDGGNLKPINIGRSGYGDSYINGYVDDVRVTLGVARYTGSSHTVPTKSLPNQ